MDMTRTAVFQAMFFAMTLYTTVGYGNIACATVAGKWASIGYAFIGIPLCLVVLARIGMGCEWFFRFTYEPVKK
jgi:hypothetical protein